MLSVSPIQFGLFAQLGQAMAGCVNTPTVHCAPPPDPGPTTPPPPPANVQYYLSPGFGDGVSTGTTDYFSGYGFQSFLGSKDAAESRTVSTNAVAADYKNTNIPTQATVFAGAIRDKATGSQKVIVVGHSTGVARIREAIQHDSSYANMDKIVGMISIGGANSGAPIAQNGPGLTGQLTTVLGAIVVAAAPQSIGVVLPGIVAVRNYVDNILSNPTGQDLWPTSSFFQKLNDPGQGPIPSQIATLEIRGQNNNIDSYIGSIWGPRSTQDVELLRKGAGNTAAVAAGLFWALAFFTFGGTVPLALAFTVAAFTFYNLPTIWKQRGVGAEAGDGLLPESTQMIPANIAGSTRFVTVLPRATHTGAFGELNIRNYGEYTDAPTMTQSIQGFQGNRLVPASLTP